MSARPGAHACSSAPLLPAPTRLRPRGGAADGLYGPRDLLRRPRRRIGPRHHCTSAPREDGRRKITQSRVAHRLRWLCPSRRTPDTEAATTPFSAFSSGAAGLDPGHTCGVVTSGGRVAARPAGSFIRGGTVAPSSRVRALQPGGSQSLPDVDFSAWLRPCGVTPSFSRSELAETRPRVPNQRCAAPFPDRSAGVCAAPVGHVLASSPVSARGHRRVMDPEHIPLRVVVLRHDHARDEQCVPGRRYAWSLGGTWTPYA